MSFRIQKVNELIRQQIAELLTRELSLKPGVFLTISKVDTSRDLRYTRIFVSVFPDDQIGYALKTLEKNIFDIQGKFNRIVALKPLPKIQFVSDLTEQKADEVEKLIKEIHQE